MDAWVIKKFKNTIVIIVSIAAAGAVVLVVTLSGMHTRGRLSRMADELEKNLLLYQRVYGMHPEGAFEKQSAALREAQQDYDALKNILGVQGASAQPAMTPLSFKQRLFDREDAVRAHAQQLRIPVPDSLGFSEYALNVPAPALVPVLMRELLAMDEVITALLESRVALVSTVVFPHKTGSAAAGKKSSLATVSMQVSCEADYSSIKKFMTAIAAKQGSYRLRQLDIKRKTPQTNQLVADMTLECVEW